jgi:protein-L-isoaspartate(D-aspartate) O-methyltransferase
MNLVQSLINQGYLKTPRIIKAFEKIKRQDFVLPVLRDSWQEDIPLSIGHGQTISQPLTVAFMLELLAPCLGDKVLDIGSGSGWTAALLAEIVGPQGKVFAIERISELKEFGENNVKKYNFIKSERVKFTQGDGTKGLEAEAPFDCIHVGAAAQKIPAPLLKQLKIKGKLIIPQGIDLQDMVLIKKIGKKEYQSKRFQGFSFVPLVGSEK